MSSFDARQRLEGMERRRRRHGPFERRRSRSPRIGRGVLLAGKRVEDAEQEDEKSGKGEIRPDRRDEVPTRIDVRIVGVAARHAGKAEEVVWEEGEIGADENQQEMTLGERYAVQVAVHFGEQIVPGTAGIYIR